MNEPTDTTEVTAAEAEDLAEVFGGKADTEATSESADTDDPADTPNREAARYRRRLRDTETERDTLKARLEALQRAQVDGIAQGLGVKPAALWAAGADLEGLCDDNGVPDAGKVKAAAEKARAELGISAPARKPSTDNLISGATGRTNESATSWQHALSDFGA